MKKKRVFLLIPLLFLGLFISLCSGCYKNQMLKYYEDDSNYKYYCGTFEKIEESKYETGKAYLYVKNIALCDDLENIIISYDSYKIVPDNLKILIDNSFYDEVKSGDTLKFVKAPSMFGDGYTIPIAAIWCNDKCYLDFETGKANILEYVRETEK